MMIMCRSNVVSRGKWSQVIYRSNITLRSHGKILSLFLCFVQKGWSISGRWNAHSTGWNTDMSVWCNGGTMTSGRSLVKV